MRMTYVLSLCIILLALYMEETETVFAEESTKYACTGDYIQLFRNVTINTTDNVVILYIQASSERSLAMWTSEKTTIAKGYTKKVFRDNQTGDIWIRNVSPSDEAQYILISRNGTNSFREIVMLSVQVAPTINCKPTIKRVGDALFASLNANECGKPMASVDWLHYPGSHNYGYDLMLPKTNRHGIYYACISGPAVTCAKTSKLADYCSTYYIDDTLDCHSISSEGKETAFFVILLTVSGILLVLQSISMWLYSREKCRHLTSSEKKKKEYFDISMPARSDQKEAVDKRFNIFMKPPSDEEEAVDKRFNIFMKPPSDEEEAVDERFDIYMPARSDEKEAVDKRFNIFMKPPSDEEEAVEEYFDISMPARSDEKEAVDERFDIYMPARSDEKEAVEGLPLAEKTF